MSKQTFPSSNPYVDNWYIPFPSTTETDKLFTTGALLTFVLSPYGTGIGAGAHIEVYVNSTLIGESYTSGTNMKFGAWGTKYGGVSLGDVGTSGGFLNFGYNYGGILWYDYLVDTEYVKNFKGMGYQTLMYNISLTQSQITSIYQYFSGDTPTSTSTSTGGSTNSTGTGTFYALY